MAEMAKALAGRLVLGQSERRHKDGEMGTLFDEHMRTIFG